MEQRPDLGRAGPCLDEGCGSCGWSRWASKSHVPEVIFDSTAKIPPGPTATWSTLTWAKATSWTTVQPRLSRCRNDEAVFHSPKAPRENEYEPDPITATYPRVQISEVAMPPTTKPRPNEP